jgi:predicted TIM-barrel fold metal-dependent hydrolase
VSVDLYRLDWIASSREEAVDPVRRIVDPHHHLWDGDDVHRYRLEELVRDTRGSHNVTDTVFLECSASYRADGPEQLLPVGETEFVREEALESDRGATRISGIVGFADLTLGDALDTVLDAHEAAGRGRFRGIRHQLTPDTTRHTPGSPTDPAFRRGVEQLGARGYTFDAWAFPAQLLDLADLARAAEATTIVVDHLGAPIAIPPYDDEAETRAMWQRGLRALAECPNVVLKLGGIGMDHYFATGWTARERPPDSNEVAARWRDTICWCIDTFGPARCMFESNFPADRQALDYSVIWNTFQRVAESYSAAEQDSLFANTAARVYRIAAR